MNKRIYLIMVMLLATSLLTNAQTWQWGKRGGSAEAGTGGPDETVVDMATDPKGNIYVLSKVLQTSLNTDGHSVTGYGNQDILLSSFKCDGTYRWSKDIGGNSTDIPTAIKTDTLGGVYLIGYVFLNSSICHISTDTTLPITNQTLLLVKYDTAGNFKWLRLPQAATVGAGSLGLTAAYDMDVDGGGNSNILSELYPGVYASGAFTAPTQGEYILKYDKNGNFLGGNSMQMTNPSQYSLFSMKKDYQNGRYYITGLINSGTPSLGGIPITHPMFIGCFNNSGTLLWVKQDTDPIAEGSTFGRPVIDWQHNIYLGGRASPTDTFNGYALINGGSGTPVAFKLDTNGNNIWAKNGSTNGATFSSTVILNGPEAIIAGQYPGRLKWAGYPDSLNLASGSGYHIFITRFNSTTGAVIGMDSLASTTGLNCDATALTSDKFGNFYIGGDFASSITVAGTTLNSIGGGSDFFIAKYGTANCTGAISLETPPEPGKFSITGIHVFPNPATDELNITGVPQATSYRLLSITGTTQMQGPLQEGNNSLPMQRLATGIYLLEMTGADGARNIVRVVKE